MAIDFEKLDPEIMDYCKEQETLLKREKNKNDILAACLRAAKEKIRKLKEQNESLADQQVLKIISKNAKEAKEAIEAEAVRRKEQEEKEQILAEQRYVAYQNNTRKLIAACAVALLLMVATMAIMILDISSSVVLIVLIQMMVCVSGACIGFLMNEAIRLIGR